jgi:hypothetical protein
MLFMFFKLTKWNDGITHIFFSRWKPEQFSRMLRQFSHLLGDALSGKRALKYINFELKNVL